MVIIVTGVDAVLAHGVAATGDSFSAFVRSGFLHMILGWDHLLFIGGILLLARDVERAMILLSVFALGHSTTLMAATLAGWRVDPRLVDVVIALSLAFVGLVGWLGPPARWRMFGTGVLLLGLVHGLGLASRLQEPSLAAHVTPTRVIAFNLGVEIAQLVAAGIAVLAGLMTWEYVRQVMSWPVLWKLLHGALTVVGLTAGGLLIATADRPVSLAGRPDCCYSTGSERGSSNQPETNVRTAGRSKSAHTRVS